jgi:AbrB family looped-hinge helix DNA binding protein
MIHSKGKYAWTVKVGEKGQIVIPKEARDVFNINPGDTLILLGDEEQGIAILPKSMFNNFIQMTFGENFENHDNLESIMVHVEKE